MLSKPFLATCLALITLYANAAFGEKSKSVQNWLTAADQYLTQERIWAEHTIGYQAEYKASAEQSFLSDLLKDLPEPEDWQLLSESFEIKDTADNSLKKRYFALKFLISYIAQDQPKIDAALKKIQAIAESDDYQLRYPSERIINTFENNANTTNDKKFEAFLNQLKSHQPIKREDVIEIVGSEANLEIIDEYQEGFSSLLRRYYALIEAGKTDESPEVLALVEEQQQREASKAQAIELINAHSSNPILLTYLQGKHSSLLPRHTPTLQVPDLVTLIGAQQAEVYLRQALLLSVKIEIYKGDATRELAQKLALELAPNLKRPQWSLAQSIHQTELYEVMATRFPLKLGANNFADYDAEQATAYYFWGLIAQKRSQEAIALLAKQPDLLDSGPYDMLKQLTEAGYSQGAWEFMDKHIAEHASEKRWKFYIELSTKLNRKDEMLLQVNRLLKSENLEPEDSLFANRLLADAYLSIGEVDKGVNHLRQILKLETTDNQSPTEHWQSAIQLGQLGATLDNESWLSDGIRSAESLLSQMPIISEYGSISAYQYTDLFQLYINSNQAEKAETGITSYLNALPSEHKKLQSASNTQNDFGFGNYVEPNLQTFLESNYESISALLVAQMGILYDRGEYGKILECIEQDPRWHATDLADIWQETDLSDSKRTIGWIVAEALRHTGKEQEASQLLEQLLLRSNGYDPYYASYLAINQEAALPFLDKLAQIDQFQERPLIWKAYQLATDGRLDEAEEIAKKAISIDPSDGEQPRDDRMRVYAVMQQIRTAQGNSQEAQFFANVLKAIRLSEKADRFHSLGLHSQAIDLYLQSLEFFQDAYCIQSRLAVRLYNEGRIDEAIVHYRKAYELMPSSFGRVESHCFGCESVFSGDEPQSIAESVFKALLEETPEIPQVHYLIGYLRDYQKRDVEALKHFQDAIKLDPLYLNAWKKIASLSNQMEMSTQQRDELALTIFNLDPLGNHSHTNLGQMNDLGKVWSIVTETTQKLEHMDIQNSIYPLKASADKLSQEAKTKLAAERESDISDFWLPHPSKVMIQNQAIQAIEEFIAATTEPDRY